MLVSWNINSASHAPELKSEQLIHLCVISVIPFYIFRHFPGPVCNCGPAFIAPIFDIKETKMWQVLQFLKVSSITGR
jgi:hypothetical protein